MIRNFKRTAAIAGIVAVSSATLVACGDSNDTETTTKSETAVETSKSTETVAATTEAAAGSYELSGNKGELKGEGSSAQKNAVDYFAQQYAAKVNGASLAYTASGSGDGVKNFIANQAAFAGSDSPLKDEEIEPAKNRCGGNEAWHLPFVIGPVAIAYNLDGVDNLVVTPELLAKIFRGEITKWNDPAVAEVNKDAKLPDQDIHVVYRSDSSGTSDNFQKFLAASTKGDWDASSGKQFPGVVGEGADKSTGVANAVQTIPGSITYVELGNAQQNGLGIAQLDLGNGPVELNPDTVGKALDNLTFKTEGHNMVVDSTKLYEQNAAGTYPLVLTTYEIVCSAGYDDQVRGQVKDFLNVSLDSQDDTLAQLGYIPVKGKLAQQLREAIDAIA
ncbi:phosphate ABC transporter substrate-binding protein PstS [Corynebacterium bouchesdurhonense]|uniref:phosphate ABC transporter substrate-binding protein PstS n=1 Tax=Corynebacterium bouchesdurhonense TaxID=1720192 RepID=UPI00082991B2|nr:phosphate ABC transporter substrate-binding protein PstS [Corynebacterium bouchesdurhonense]